uniref:Uncharacterized protein n=1 Tax=Manihot esculenta TaxID=3983 RepID=A0A2C9U0I7_MANES
MSIYTLLHRKNSYGVGIAKFEACAKKTDDVTWKFPFGLFQRLNHTVLHMVPTASFPFRQGIR